MRVFFCLAIRNQESRKPELCQSESRKPDMKQETRSSQMEMLYVKFTLQR